MAALGVGSFFKTILDRNTLMKIAMNPEAAFSAIAAKLKLQQKAVTSEDDHIKADHVYSHLSTLAERKQCEMATATLMLDGARVTLLVFAEPSQNGQQQPKVAPVASLTA